MKEIHLDQGNPDWLAWRAGNAFTDIFGVKHPALDGPRITATAGSVCGGKSPFSTMHRLWQEMTGRRQREEATFAMDRGNALEPKARQLYNSIVGVEYEALCVESTATPWIAASLDGVDLLRTRGVEIKCPISERIHDMAMLGQVPDYYYDQIQWQMLATDNQIKEIDFFSYATGSYVLLQADVDAAKDRLKKIAAGKSTQGSGVMVIVSSNDGRTNWEKVAVELSARLQLPQGDLEVLALANKSKPTTVTTIKEASDADVIYREITAVQSSVVSMEIEAETIEQPTPLW